MPIRHRQIKLDLLNDGALISPMSHFSSQVGLPPWGPARSDISLPSTIVSTSTSDGNNITNWEYIQNHQRPNSWLGPVPQPTQPRVLLTPDFLLPSQREFYRNRPIWKLLRGPARYLATTGILYNDAPTWLAVTLPKINDNTTLTSKIVFAFEFHPFVNFCQRCLNIAHSALVEQNRQKRNPVYAEPPESDFPGGGKSSNIYFV